MVVFRDQDDGQSQSIKTENGSFERMEQFKYLRTTLTSNFYSGRNEEQNEVRECLLSFGVQSFVFRCFIQKYKY
jgi:hypothetical protein